MKTSNNSVKKPKLDKSISLKDFKNYYWHTKELKEFCRNIGINPNGLKLDLNKKIEKYLTTGEIETNKNKISTIKKNTILGIVNDFTTIPENVLLTTNIREYFEVRVKNKFRFTKELIKYLRENSGKKFGDALNEYIAFKNVKKGTIRSKKEIPPQCQYNQFIKDYLKENPNKKFINAVEEWNKVKIKQGDFKYKKS